MLGQFAFTNVYNIYGRLVGSVYLIVIAVLTRSFTVTG